MKDSFPDRNAFMLPPLDHVPVEPAKRDILPALLLSLVVAVAVVGLVIGFL